jgi:hypothetical protein
VLTPHMTRETTYANERLTIELCGLDRPPTLLRSSNVGALTFSARVVMSYLKDPLRQSVEPEERGCSPKSRTGLRYQCKCSYHCSLRAGERKAVHCMAVDKRGPDIVTQILFRRRLTHLNDSLGNFWGRENRKRGQHPVWVLLHGQRSEPQGETEPHFIQERTSRNFDRSRHPNPAPVPPPSEWMIWNP